MKIFKDMNRWVLLLVGFVAVFTSCEKVIDVPLNEADQRIVVEGKLYDQAGESEVLLSKTGSVYDDSGFEKISGAQVTITDQLGTITMFDEDPLIPGRYFNNSFVATSNNTYTLNILVEGKELSAISTTYGKPTLDSLFYIETVGGFGPQAENDTSYLVFYDFSDVGGIDNYYRLRPFINGKEDEIVYITDDKLFDGNTYSAPIFATDINKGDTVLMKLVSMDEENYTFNVTLASNTQDGAFASAPANPVSNIEGDAIGYFGAFTTDTLSIIIE